MQWQNETKENADPQHPTEAPTSGQISNGQSARQRVGGRQTAAERGNAACSTADKEHDRSTACYSRLISRNGAALHVSLPRNLKRNVVSMSTMQVAQLALLIRLTAQLLVHFRLQWRWLRRFACVLMYACIMLPAFMRLAWFYFTSHTVQRNIRYGPAPRNLLDVFSPVVRGTQSDGGSTGKSAVCVVVMGGAWIIGYKGWATLIAKLLTERNVLVVAVDYRNFPQGTISDMVQDVTTAIAWVFANIGRYGGDADQVTLVGQAAGAHILTLSLMRQAEAALLHDSVATTAATTPQVQHSGVSEAMLYGIGDLRWQPSRVKAFVSVSGTFDIEHIVDYLDSRGLYKHVLWSIMEAGLTGRHAHDALPKWSPTQLASAVSCSTALRRSVPQLFLLLHGALDASSPASQTTDFAAALERCGLQGRIHQFLCPRATHTDMIIEDLLLHGHRATFILYLAAVATAKRQHLQDIHLNRLFASSASQADEAAQASWPTPMLPHVMIQLARIVNPF